MSGATSPARFNANSDHYDTSFAADINNKMRVPKRIRVTGDDDDFVHNANYTRPDDKVEMNVPDRILVVGCEQHVGTRAPPRELVLENAVMPPDPGLVRVQTPPRVISLRDHEYPAADDDSLQEEENNSALTPIRQKINGLAGGDAHLLMGESEAPALSSQLDVSVVSQSDDIQHFRRQLARLNRRIMALEMDQQARSLREKTFYGFCAMLMVMKAFTWLRGGSPGYSGIP